MTRFRNLLAWMGGIAAVLLFLHALGISAKIMEGQYGRAAAIGQIETATTDTSATQVAVLQAQIDGIRADRDGQVTRLQASIDGIVNDGLNNDQLADAYRADQVAAENDARERIRPLEDQITALTTAAGATVVEATEAKTKVDSFNPLFTFMARVASWTWNPAVMPSETLQFGMGFGFLTLFFGFGEVLMMACFTIAYGMQIVVARRRETPVQPLDETAGPAPEGFTDMRFTNEEWAAYQQAMEDAKRREKEAADARSDAAAWRAPIPIAHKGWVRDKKREIIGLHESGSSPNDIFEATGFGTWNEFEAFVRKVFNKKAAGKILGQPLLETPDPRAAEPPATLGDYMPETPATDELDIPPEPLEYPVAPYEPPANDDPQDKDAA
jgi:hypothetical protein